MQTQIHSRDLIEMARGAQDAEFGISARALGWSVISRILSDCRGEQEQRSFSAWENADDFRLGVEALNVLRAVRARGNHVRWTARLEVS